MFEQQDLVKIATTVMPFGKYRGKLLIDLPEEYLLWFAKREFPQGKLGLLLQLCLEIRINGLESIIDPLRSTQIHSLSVNLVAGHAVCSALV